MELQEVDFYGLKISVFTKEELIKSIEEVIQSNQSKVYYGYSLAVLVYLKKYSSYYKITSKFEVMVTDGRVFYLLAKFFGFKLKYDISIPRLTLLTLDISNKNQYKLMLVGGSKESNLLAYENIKQKYPNIQLCQGVDGYFSDNQKKNVFQKIKQNNPDILLLGLPTPQKQIFASEIKNKLTACVIIPCGGMIDVLAGNEKLTPIWIKKIGLASIYRHIQHPSRIPELLKVYILTLKVIFVCFYLKYIKKSKEINIPSIIQKK